MIPRQRHMCPMVAAVVLAGVVATAVAADSAKQQHTLIGVQEDNATDAFQRTTHPGAQWFPEAGLGLFLHWGISSAHPRGGQEISWAMMKNLPWDPDNRHTVTPREYFALAETFDPQKYDPDKWIAAAARAGFRYAVLTTKHHDGYALWPSDAGDYDTGEYLDGRDLVRPFVEACRRHGLKVGLYYSPPDWHFMRDYMTFNYGSQNRAQYPDRPHLGLDHEPVELTPAPPEYSAQYQQYIHDQVVELLTRYGRIDLLWFDGGPEAIGIDEIRALQPHIVVNPRMHGRGDFETPECRLPESRPEGWWEVCTIVSRGWAYKKDEWYQPLGKMLDWLSQTRAWDGNLLLNVGPRPTGELPDVVYERFEEMERWMAHSGQAVFGVKGGPWPEKCSVPVTVRADVWYLHVLTTSEPPVRLQVDAQPQAVRLLRSGTPLPWQVADGAVLIDLPTDLRGDEVDIIEVQW